MGEILHLLNVKFVLKTGPTFKEAYMISLFFFFFFFKEVDIHGCNVTS